MIETYEAYSPLDALGRCGRATACLGPESLPPEGERRREMRHIQPSGWHFACYDQSVVPGESLYNRTHLIARCLCKNGDAAENIITGTQYLNQSTMQPLENRVVGYIRQTNNHVLYRVTPVFEGDDLIARGVRVEARSAEDGGAGISLNLYCYNVQPGVEIDYATGESRCVHGLPAATLSMKGYLLGDPSSPAIERSEPAGRIPDTASDSTTSDALPSRPLMAGAPVYALNFASQRFHARSCKSIRRIAARNEGVCHLDRTILVALGYMPCGRCNP